MDTPEAIERAAELGFLAGADLAQARAQLDTPPGAHINGALRAIVHIRITELVGAFDAHNAEAYAETSEGRAYLCPCNFRGTREEWDRHLADKLADALAGE
ncbi:hypothetical protein [Mycobacterium sp. CnD-18-1]|uniref:hypothetical protein n=1 Tax=Mycobacterium sp. CnD-18-1 TaxID=2917744 RepID=UPI001EF2CB65|nr:hypothetical protein [Mycobacterium sp. CnD-18-1]MCG7610371.1 hypothetical protein [Mycobacterium sp. CnD-18-1]